MNRILIDKTRHLNSIPREFKVTAIDYNPKTYYEKVGLDATPLSEPPLTKNMFDTEIKNIKEIQPRLNYPCHILAVEYHVKLVTE